MNLLTKNERDSLEDLFLEIANNTHTSHEVGVSMKRFLQTIVVYIKGMRF